MIRESVMQERYEKEVYDKLNAMVWKELNKDTPLDVVLNKDKYDIEIYAGGWVKLEETESRKLFREIEKGFLMHRYRLKPLEPIRITQDNLLALSNYYFNKDMTREDFEKAYCRPVEFIDE